jgi:integrase
MAHYSQRLPHDVDLTKTFWFKPLKTVKETGVWFSKMPIGEKSLATFVKDMMNEAGYKGNYTNHSLRTTTVNRMIDAGLNDGEIMNRTGHRSSTTIAKYRQIIVQQ